MEKLDYLLFIMEAHSSPFQVNLRLILYAFMEIMAYIQITKIRHIIKLSLAITFK
jgi:hypothetical protein